jgi:hypothetical protein
MKRKQFVKIVDTLIARLEKNEPMYTCNEIDTICLGSLSIESDMRVAYEKIMGLHGQIPVGFIDPIEFDELDLQQYSALSRERNSALSRERKSRRIIALSLFREWILRSGDYKGFNYEK